MTGFQSVAMPEPPRDVVDARPGWTLLEFGAAWCPHCLGIQPALKEQVEAHSDVAHLKIEDGKGKPLGRSYGVKLWPTLIFLRDGVETQRLVRPSELELRQAFDQLKPGTA